VRDVRFRHRSRLRLALLLLWLTILLWCTGCAGQKPGACPSPEPTPAEQTDDRATVGSRQTSSPLPTPGPISPPPTPLIARSPLTTPPSAPLCSYYVVRHFPHAPDAFTEGLAFSNGVLFEGTGLKGRSSLRQVDLESGEVSSNYALPNSYFGEGITTVNGRLIELTWHAGVAFVYDTADIAAGPTGQFGYTSEGWGLTYDGQHLVMSDGTATLTFRDPDTFEVVRKIQVLDGPAPVTQLNELEYVKSEILANVWQTNRIAVIDPRDGSVTCWVDLTDVAKDANPDGRADVLNGIAYDPVEDRLVVTGKLWPKMYEIVVELPAR